MLCQWQWRLYMGS